MLVTVEVDSMGNVTMDPVNARKRAAFVRDMQANGWQGDESEALIFGQGDAGEELLAVLAPGAARDAREGWTVKARVDSWTVRQLAGYSAA